MKRMLLLFCLLFAAHAAFGTSYFEASWTNQGVPGTGFGATGAPLQWYTAYFLTLDSGVTGAAVTIQTTQGPMYGVCAKFAQSGCIVTFEINPQAITAVLIYEERSPLEFFERKR